MALTKTAVDLLGAKLADDNVDGPVTPTGMIKGAKGTVIVNPSTSSPRTSKTGPLVDSSGEIIKSPSLPSQQQAAEPVKKTRKRAAKAEPPKQTVLKATVHVNGMDITTQYVHFNIGNGILVLWLNELSFVPPISMCDAQGNVVGKVQFSNIQGEWANLGQTFTDRDGTKCVVLHKIARRPEDVDGKALD